MSAIRAGAIAGDRERFCPTGNHWALRSRFRVREGGGMARDCITCEAERRRRVNAKPEEPRFDGVDIDAIHYKLGAIRRQP